MSTMGRALFALCSVSLLAGLSGCFTEVGNPEDEAQMTASFQMDYTPVSPDSSSTPLPSSVSILRSRLLFEDANYVDTDSTQGELWQNPKGYPVDLTGSDPSAMLPAQTLKSTPLTSLTLNFGFLPRKAIEADTINFGAFQASGYMKGTYILPGDTTNEFLFALPDTSEDLALKYTESALQGWRQNGNYHCQVSFMVYHWLSNVNLAQAVIDKDSTGRNIVLLDPEHNPGLYTALTSRFYQSFNTQQAYWDTTGSSQ